MKFVSFFIFIFVVAEVFGQKETLEVFEAADIENIIISTDEVFKIELSTTSEDLIRIRTTSEGEYYNSINLDSEIRKETLLLTSRYREILRSGYDKLSAHKVFSMKVELLIPENMKVTISSNLASVYAKGNYAEMLIQLKTGSCYLSNFSGNAIVNTYNGNIIVETNDARIEAFSRHGEVSVPQKPFGNHKIKLTSINGNIRVQKTK